MTGQVFSMVERCFVFRCMRFYLEIVSTIYTLKSN